MVNGLSREYWQSDPRLILRLRMRKASFIFNIPISMRRRAVQENEKEERGEQVLKDGHGHEGSCIGHILSTMLVQG